MPRRAPRIKLYIMKLIKCRLTADIEINIFIFISSCVNLICPGLTRAFLHKKTSLGSTNEPRSFRQILPFICPNFLKAINLSGYCHCCKTCIYSLSFFLSPADAIKITRTKVMERKLWKEANLIILRLEEEARGQYFFELFLYVSPFLLLVKYFSDSYLLLDMQANQ